MIIIGKFLNTIFFKSTLFVNTLIFSTIVIEPGCVALYNKYGDVEIEIGSVENENRQLDVAKLDRIQLSIFSHRFSNLIQQAKF